MPAAQQIVLHTVDEAGRTVVDIPWHVTLQRTAKQCVNDIRLFFYFMLAYTELRGNEAGIGWLCSTTSDAVISHQVGTRYLLHSYTPSWRNQMTKQLLWVVFTVQRRGATLAVCEIVTGFVPIIAPILSSLQISPRMMSAVTYPALHELGVRRGPGGQWGHPPGRRGV